MIKNCLYAIHNCVYAIHNCRYWFKIICKDKWWDYTFILIILQHKLKQVEKMTREHGNHVNNIKDADNIKKTILVLERMIEQDYYSEKDYRKDGKLKNLANIRQKQDLDYLTTLLNKHLFNWWD